MKKHFRVIFSDFGRISCDFRLDIRDFGKKCEIKGNKEKSRESEGSGQGKQPWGVGRYGTCPCRAYHGIGFRISKWQEALLCHLAVVLTRDFLHNIIVNTRTYGIGILELYQSINQSNFISVTRT